MVGQEVRSIENPHGWDDTHTLPQFVPPSPKRKLARTLAHRASKILSADTLDAWILNIVHIPVKLNFKVVLSRRT